LKVGRMLWAIFYAIGAGLLAILLYFTVMYHDPLILPYIYVASLDPIFRWLGIDQFLLSLPSFLIRFLFGLTIPFLGLAAIYYFISRSVRLTRAFFRKRGV
jgi:hypothetical protein